MAEWQNGRYGTMAEIWQGSDDRMTEGKQNVRMVE